MLFSKTINWITEAKDTFVILITYIYQYYSLYGFKDTGKLIIETMIDQYRNKISMLR